MRKRYARDTRVHSFSGLKSGVWEEMAEGGFNELELLSQKDLIGKLLKVYKELSRREDVTRDFLKTLCGFSPEMQVWFILWEGGGAQRFTEILLVAGCSRSKLIKILRELLNVGLVRMVEKRYQAVSPASLVLI